VAVIGVGGRLECVNAAAAMFLRSTREKLVGSLLSSSGVDGSVVELIESLRGAGASRRGSVEVRETGGGESDAEPGVFRFNARRAGRGDAGSIVLVIEDVTQQRLADESRTTLLASAAHELRTPLTNIRLWLEEYVDAGEDDEATRNEAINVIGQESRRLERIVTDVLSVSELEAGSIRLNIGDIRLDALLRELESDFRAQAEETGVRLAFDVPPRVPVVEGDRDRFELVLHNLVGNALKYTSRGGAVSVSLEEEEREVSIAVRDTGFGISDEEQERVFERFYRAGDDRLDGITGTGLGLSIAREVMRRHGGDIRLESKLNEGSTFTVRMPKSRSRAQAA
jgi:two-component system sensor histidine kinase VicK